MMNKLTPKQRQAIEQRQATYRVIRSHLIGAVDAMAQAEMGCKPSDHCFRCRSVAPNREQAYLRGAVSHLVGVIKGLRALGFDIEDLCIDVERPE